MYLHIVLLDGHVYSCVHVSQNVKAFFTSIFGSDVHEHEDNIQVLNVDVDVEVLSSSLRCDA